MRNQLRQLMETESLIIAPGVYDGLSAILAEREGFKVIYASGGAISRAHGYPDIGLLSFTEVLAALGHIVKATTLPIIADADTGFGNEINVQRTVQEFERIGVAGLHLEDQTFPKRCGHLNEKSLISVEEMCLKIKVAKFTASPDFVVIARTDAIAVEGFDAAINRALQYKQAGADVIFIEAPETVEQIEQIGRRIPGPKLINMFSGGKTPVISPERLIELGYSIVIIPSDLQRASIKAMQNVLAEIKVKGNSSRIEAQMVTFEDREQIVKTGQYLGLSKAVLFSPDSSSIEKNKPNHSNNKFTAKL